MTPSSTSPRCAHGAISRGLAAPRAWCLGPRSHEADLSLRGLHADLASGSRACLASVSSSLRGNEYFRWEPSIGPLSRGWPERVPCGGAPTRWRAGPNTSPLRFSCAAERRFLESTASHGLPFTLAEQDQVAGRPPRRRPGSLRNQQGHRAELVRAERLGAGGSRPVHSGRWNCCVWRSERLPGSARGQVGGSCSGSTAVDPLREAPTWSCLTSEGFRSVSWEIGTDGHGRGSSMRGPTATMNL